MAAGTIVQDYQDSIQAYIVRVHKKAFQLVKLPQPMDNDTARSASCFHVFDRATVSRYECMLILDIARWHCVYCKIIAHKDYCDWSIIDENAYHQ
jgi:hypothetical protein